MKKYLFVLFFILFYSAASAQNCADWIVSEYDEVTDITVLSMKDRMYITRDGQRKISLFVAQKIESGERQTVLTFDVRDGGCISNRNLIIFLFEDGTRLKLFNHGPFNCEGFTKLYIGIPTFEGPTIKDYLETRRIRTLRV